MQVVYERCCGLDVHKKSVVACVLITETSGQMQRHIRTFSTITAGLLALADWLESMSVTVVALESTGVYWRALHPCGGKSPKIQRALPNKIRKRRCWRLR